MIRLAFLEGVMRACHRLWLMSFMRIGTVPDAMVAPRPCSLTPPVWQDLLCTARPSYIYISLRIFRG